MNRRALLGFMALLLLDSPAQAEPETIGWRLDGSGAFPDARPPIRWSASTGENIAWKTPMPSWSNGSPILAQGKIFITSEPAELLAMDATTGAILWRRSHDFLDTLGAADRAKAEAEIQTLSGLEALLETHQREANRLRREVRRKRADPALVRSLEETATRVQETREKIDGMKARYHVIEAERVSHQFASGFVGSSSSTPVVHGDSVYALFGNGVVGCHSLSGERRWMRWVGKPSDNMRGYHSGHAASPVLVDGVLVVAAGPLLGIDAKTGEERWRGSTYQDFGTSARAQIGDAGAVITPNGDRIRARDGVMLGKPLALLWYIGPLIRDDRAYFVGNSEGRTLGVAFDLAGKELWRTQLPKGRYYATPTPAGGLLHVGMRFGQVLALNSDTGQIAYETSRKLKKPIEVYSSPVWAAGRLYVTSDDGKTLVLAVEAKGYRKLALNDLEEMRSSFFLSGDAIYVRGLRHLYKIAAPTP